MVVLSEPGRGVAQTLRRARDRGTGACSRSRVRPAAHRVAARRTSPSVGRRLAHGARPRPGAGRGAHAAILPAAVRALTPRLNPFAPSPIYRTMDGQPSPTPADARETSGLTSRLVLAYAE